MKLTLSVLIALLLSDAAACAQQPTGASTNSEADTGATQSSTERQGSSVSISSGSSPTIRIIGIRQTSPLLAEMFNALRSSRRSLA